MERQKTGKYMIVLALAWLLSGSDGVRAGGAICEPRPACAAVVVNGPVAWVPAATGPRLTDSGHLFPVALAVMSADTVDQGLFEYSDGYMTRLDIHRAASYTALPLFLAQIVIGEVLLRERESPPGWAKYSHAPIAGALAGLFVVNTVTGGLNLLEARRDPNVDGRSMLHSMVMLLADAGFVATALTVGQAGTVAPNGRVRTKHRKVALISMGIATTGYLMMIPPFRKD